MTVYREGPLVCFDSPACPGHTCAIPGPCDPLVALLPSLPFLPFARAHSSLFPRVTALGGSSRLGGQGGARELLPLRLQMSLDLAHRRTLPAVNIPPSLCKMPKVRAM